MASDEIQRVVDAIRAGKPVLLPTDGVYGLCASAYREAAARRLYQLKGRGEDQPTALIAASVDMLLECIPELRGRSGVIARAVLPGPYTLILPNPARRYRWLTGLTPDAIGIRVAELPTASQRVLDAVGAVVATSANEPGGRSPASLDEVPERLRAGSAAELDAGRLSGEASTVIDFTGREPVVLRQGPGDAGDAIARVREALAGSSAA